MTSPRPARVRIDTLRVTATSAVEAHRLADALPAAIERAWTATETRTETRTGQQAASARPRTGADVVAERIVLLARAELAAEGWRA